MENSDDTREAGIERRVHRRHTIPVAVNCRLFKEDIKGKNSFQGFIQDISLGGVSLEIRDDTLVLNDALLMYLNVEMTFAIDMPDGTHKVNVSGIVRWYKKAKRKGVNHLYLGVQFLNLEKSDGAILEKYLALGARDKSLIWNLWDNLSINP
jgi:hypothetical protein